MPKQQRPNGTPRKKLSIAALDRTFADRWALSHLGRIWGFVSSLSDGHRMGVPPQKHCLSPSRRRALDLLASSPDGATKETIVRVYGISRDIIAGLVRTGLATVRHETVRAGSEMIRVKRYRITNAGRMALEGWPVRLIRPPR
jgi:hypothetical protein